MLSSPNTCRDAVCVVAGELNKGHFDLQLLQPQTEGFGKEAALDTAVGGEYAVARYLSPSS